MNSKKFIVILIKIFDFYAAIARIGIVFAVQLCNNVRNIFSDSNNKMLNFEFIKSFMKQGIITVLFWFTLFTIGFGQFNKTYAQSSPENIPHYDNKAVIFGWYIGGNTMYTNITDGKALPYNDSIMAFNALSRIGGQIGLLGDLRLLSFLHVRFLPNISFSDRTFEFLIKEGETFHTTKQNFEVIYLDLPIELKIAAKRWHNFRPYLIGGFKYDYDLGSIRRKKIADNEFLFKINETEMYYTLGAGFDFYFPFFKMTVELKSAFGLTDVLNKEYRTVYSDCIDKMKSQMFYINVIFQ